MASIKKRGKTWQYRVSYTDKDGNRKFINKGGFKTKAEASAHATVVEAEVLQGFDLSNAATPFYDYYVRFFELRKRDNLSPRTLGTYERTMHYIKTFFGTTPLIDVTNELYQQALDKHGETHAVSTTRKFHHHMKACFLYAFHNGVIKINPSHAVIVKGQKPKTKQKFLSEAEMTKLMQYIIDSISLDRTVSYMLLVSHATGMRIGEVMALSFDSVDVQNNILTINQSYDYQIELKNKSTKTDSSVRKVRIDKTTMSHLKSIINDRRALSKRYGKNPQELIFVNRDTLKPLSWNAVQKAINNCCKQAGVPRITSHAFRHTHASVLMNHNVSDAYIAKRLGHGDTTMLKQVYGHVLEELDEKDTDQTVELIEKFLE